MSEVDGKHRAQAAGIRWVPVVSPGAGETLRLLLLSDAVYPVPSHWWGGFTLPCPGARKCRACQAGKEPRLYAYLAAHSPKLGRTVLARLTNETLMDCPRLMESSLRGRWLQLQRAGGGPLALVTAAVLEDEPYEGRLPEPPVIPTVLARLWGQRPLALLADGGAAAGGDAEGGGQ